MLSVAEAPDHPHNKIRGTFVEIDGVTQPGPAPRFSRTVPHIRSPPALAGQHTDEVLSELGFDRIALETLRAHGVIA